MLQCWDGARTPERSRQGGAMLFHVAIHRPKPEFEKVLTDSMHRFGAAARTQAGLREVQTLRDMRIGVLVGLAAWESVAALEAARPALPTAPGTDVLNAMSWTPLRESRLQR